MIASFAYSRSLLALSNCALLLIGLFTGLSLEARLGEQAGDIERRMLSPGHGREYPTERIIGKRNQIPNYGLIDNYQKATNNSLTHQIYWKSHDGRRIPSHGLRDGDPEGWDLHVFFKNGRSVLEVYLRRGSNLNQYEINGLLMANKANSAWVRSTDKSPSAIGYDFHREDGLFRARQIGGNSFWIFYAALDDEMVKVQEAASKKREEEQAKNVTSSLVGF